MIKVKDDGVNIKIEVKTDHGDRKFIAYGELELIQILVSECMISGSEVEAMLHQFDMKGHNYAEFGRYGAFIFSKFDRVLH